MVVNAGFTTKNSTTSNAQSLTQNFTNILGDRYFDLDTLKTQIAKSDS